MAPLPIRPLLAFAISLAAALCWQGPAAAETVAPGSLRVVDGDTVRLGRERIRIEGIDTPELRGQCTSERRRAIEARTRLRGVLAGRTVEIHRHGRDRYGRTLATLDACSTGQCIAVGPQLIAEGYAVAWEGRRHDWCAP